MAWTEIHRLYGGSYEDKQPVRDPIKKDVDELTIAS